MDETEEEAADVLSVLTHHAEHDLTTLLEDAFFAENAEGVDDVGGETEGNDLRHAQLGTLFEDTVEIDMGYFAGV